MNPEEETLFEKYLRRELSDLEAQRLKDVLDRPGGTRRFVAFVQEWTLVGEVSRRLEAARRPGPDPSALRPGTPRSGLRHLRAVRRSRLARRAAWLGLAAGGLAAAAVFLAALGAARPTPPRPAPEAPPPVARTPRPVPEGRAQAPAAPESAALPAPAEAPAPPAAPPPAAPRPEAPTPAAAPTPEPPAPAPPPPAPAPPPAPTAPAVARVEEVGGEVLLVGPAGAAPARAGSPVAEGQGVRTGPQGRAVLAWPDGTHLELGPDSEIGRFGEGGRSVLGFRGTLSARVARRAAGEGPAVFAGAFARVVVLGTRFALRSDAEHLRVEVQEGKVRLERPADGAAAEVAAGQAGTAGPSGRLEVRLVPLSRHFQDGFEGYAGTADAMIWGAEPDRAFGAEPQVKVDGNDGGHPAYGLVRWDLSGIPPSASVRSAVVTLMVENVSVEREYRLYEVRRAWSEEEVTWRRCAAGRSWRAPGARGAGDRGGEVLGTVRPGRAGEVAILLNDAGVAAIQSWVRSPALNHGFLIAADGGADGFAFSARESPDPARRPKLTVAYVLGK